MSKPSFAEQLKRNLSRQNFSLKTLTAIVLFGLIIIVFVFFGYSGRMAMGRGAIARVNNAYISMADLGSKTQELERMYSGMFGGNIGDSQRKYIEQQAMESLIQGELFSQFADKNGIYATDREIQHAITTEIPVFQDDNGSFRFESYRAVLEGNRLTPAEFEERMRNDKKAQRLRYLFEVSSTPLSAEIQQLKELEETQFNFQFAKVERDRVLAAFKISEADVKARLATPDFQKRVADEFQANSKTYDQEEQVKAQHILVKGSDDAALKKIRSIKERAAKEDFGKLASELTEDLGSKATKGDLGYFGRGRMVPEFDQAAFSQGIGVVGEPVKTQFGYHLIKVLDKKPAMAADLKSVEAVIARRMMGDEKFDDLIKKLDEAVATGNSGEIDKALMPLAAKWQETGYVNIGTDQIPALGSVVATQAAFELSTAKPLSRVIRDGGQRIVVKFKDKTVKPAANFDSETVARERAFERMNQWLQGLRKSSRVEVHLENEVAM